MAEAKKPNCLVVDDKEAFREIVAFFIQGLMDCELFFAVNGAEAIDVLERQQIDLIFCDYNMPVKNGAAVYQFVLERKLQARFILCSSMRAKDLPAFSNARSLYATIDKINLKNEITEVLARFKKEFFQEKSQFQEKDFSLIRIQFLLQLGDLPVDVFIKIPIKDFIKTFHKGDVFDEADFVRFRQKGIHELFFLTKEKPLIYDAISKKISSIKEAGDDEVDVQVEIQELLVGSAKEFGIQPELVKHLETHFLEVLALVEKDKDLNMLLKKVLNFKGAYLGKHSLLLANFSALIAVEAYGKEATSIKSLIIASLMHDIFLDTEVENESDFLLSGNPDQSFIEHPQKAADMMKQVKSISTDVSRMILEQHEVGPPFGLPANKKPAEVSPLGTLFSFSHFVVDTILKLHSEGRLNNENFHNLMEQFSAINKNYKKFYAVVANRDFFQE